MLPRLEEIKERRTNLGMKQKELARMVGIKPSMLNMIENGNAKPSVAAWEKIDNTLDTLEQVNIEELQTAGKICVLDVKHVLKSSPVSDAVRIMEVNDISQLPVYEYNWPIGIITERSILKQINEDKESMRKQIGKVKDLIEPAPPIIDWNHKITPAVINLLNYSPCILVSKERKIAGIITKIDAIKGLTKK